MMSLPSSGPSLANSARAAGISLLLCSTATVPNTRPEGWLQALTSCAFCSSWTCGVLPRWALPSMAIWSSSVVSPARWISHAGEDALEGSGVELGEHALEGGFLGIVAAAAAFAVAAKGAELKLGELGGEGGQVALAAHDA